MLKKGTPDYDKKHIHSIVEFLYNAGAEKKYEQDMEHLWFKRL
jgi:hypothetical protein